MKSVIRGVMYFLRLFPRSPQTEEGTISLTAMQTAKVIPLAQEEEVGDQPPVDVTNSQVRETQVVELFSVDEESPGVAGSTKAVSIRLDEGERNYLRRKCFESNNVSEYEYFLRETNYFDYDGEQEDVALETSTFSTCVMKTTLFEKDGLSEIINDDYFIQKLHKIISYEELHGPRPNLPFTLESFLQYLFVESRDLKLIRVMLMICQQFPSILRKYNEYLASREDIGVREHLLLPFLVNIKNVDPIAASATLQLMGFKNLLKLMMYYEDFMDDESIREALNILGYEEAWEYMKENGSSKNNEYIYEYDMA